MRISAPLIAVSFCERVRKYPAVPGKRGCSGILLASRALYRRRVPTVEVKIRELGIVFPARLLVSGEKPSGLLLQDGSPSFFFLWNGRCLRPAREAKLQSI